MKSSKFNFERFGLLFRRYFSERLRSEMIYWGIMLFVFLFIHHNLFAIGSLLFVSGAFYAARFLREIHSPANGIAYFMLPATQLEKIAFAIVITTFYYLALMAGCYVIGNPLGTFLNNMLAGLPLVRSGFMELNDLLYPISYKWVLLDVFDSSHSHSHSYFRIFTKVFVALQSLYLLGGIYFKSNQVFKTFFVKNLLGVFLSVLIVLETRFLIGSEKIPAILIQNPKFALIFGDAVYGVVDWGLCLLPLFFWVVAYFRLTEKEV
jgi:hypothetical protein